MTIVGRSFSAIRPLAMTSALGIFLIFSAFAHATVSLKPLLNVRAREEVFNTLNANPALSNDYTFGTVRGRFGGDLQWEPWKAVTLHTLGHASGAYGLPNNGSFGAGRNYFVNSGSSDTSPWQVGVAELSFILRPIDPLLIQVGRQGIKEGAETTTGDARLDWVKQARLSERLIGIWEWPTLARRYDGATGRYNAEHWNVSGFGARILQGGFDFNNAFKQLETVETGGISFTAKRGTWVPQSEVRLFDIIYRDRRASTIVSLGDRLLINGIGASVVGVYPYGPGAFDLLIWNVYEFGDYGSLHQSADAFILEGGYGWPKAVGSPWIRTGVAYAAGDGEPNDDHHGTFFNMAPTNHKFYGIQDINALQNLVDMFLQFRLDPRKQVKLDMQGHLYRLADATDAWYGGSGPSNNTLFGYDTRRRAGGGRALDADIGSEIDLVATWAPHKRVSLELGVSHFDSGSAATAVFPAHGSANFFYFQTSLQY